MTFTRRLQTLVLGLFLLVGVPSWLGAADLTVTAASVVPDSGYQYVDVTAGVTITAGQAVFLDSTNSSKAALAKSDTAAHATISGIALQNASAGQPIRIMTGGTLNPGATVTVGKVYVVSANGGGIAPVSDLASGNYVTIIGIGTTSSKIVLSFKVSGVTVP
jgi:hypothetical protein